MATAQSGVALFRRLTVDDIRESIAGDIGSVAGPNVVRIGSSGAVTTIGPSRIRQQRSTRGSHRDPAFAAEPNCAPANKSQGDRAGAEKKPSVVSADDRA